MITFIRNDCFYRSAICSALLLILLAIANLAAAQGFRIEKVSRTQSTPVKEQLLSMFVGEIQVFPFKPVGRVVVGNDAIVQVQILESNELVFIAKAAGSTSVRLWHQGGRQAAFKIRVDKTDPETHFHLEKMVNLKVKMVEFNKQALARLGIDRTDTLTASAVANTGESLFSTGDATLLADPVLSCINGGSARFLAGGEVPYPVVAANGRSGFEFREYGVKLEVSPRIDQSGNVQTDILAEVSTIDPSVNIQGAPGLLTRRAQTQVNMQAGQTIVLAGLLKAESSGDIDKIPGLARLPILGRLFQSQKLQNGLSELVIFITPEVIDPEAPALSNRHQRIELFAESRLSAAAKRLLGEAMGPGKMESREGTPIGANTDQNQFTLH